MVYCFTDFHESVSVTYDVMSDWLLMKLPNLLANSNHRLNSEKELETGVNDCASVTGSRNIRNAFFTCFVAPMGS